MRAVGGLAQRAVEQLERTAEHQLVEVEGADDRGQRHPELLADPGQRSRSSGRRPRRAAPQVRARPARVSRQPRREHAHGSPSGSTTTWPISPAADGGRAAACPRAPGRRRHRCRPGSASARRRRSSPKVCSPRTAVLASLATKTGRSSASRSPCGQRRVVPAQVRRVDRRRPRRPRRPGLPTPTPSTGRSVIAISSPASRCTSATASAPFGAVERAARGGPGRRRPG